MACPGFHISNRHYQTILQQAQDNFPQETGGFLGGKEFMIRAILPSHNQHLFNRTTTYGITAEDIERAHRFFAKHQLEYYGVYHTHPKGIPYPSKQDIMTGNKYHFIVGLKDPQHPIFCAYEIEHRTPVQVPLTVVPDSKFSVVDIHQKNTTPAAKTPEKAGPLPPQTLIKRDPKSEAILLYDLLDNIKKEKPSYKKQDPLTHGSDFSTLA